MKNLHSSGKLDYIDLNIHSSKYRKNSTYEAPTCFQPLGWTRLCREASYRDPELYEKYQGDGPGIAPEWRLLFAVMGSAFMVAYNNNSTKTDNNLNDILRNNPELIKDFDQQTVSIYFKKQKPNNYIYKKRRTKFGSSFFIIRFFRHVSPGILKGETSPGNEGWKFNQLTCEDSNP